MGLFLRHQLVFSASRIAIVAASTALAGCSGTSFFSESNPSSTQNLIVPDKQDVVGGAAYWGAKYEANREDTAAAVSFARNLRMMGGAQQAVILLKEVVTKAPDDATVLSEYGKALTAVGRSTDALPFFARSIQMSHRDWTAFSAYGVALDQTGNHKAAQTNYQTALDLSPANPSIEGNLAMSYVLAGQIAEGEIILRRLVARPDATAQMRQNLAMIASIKGDKVEAESLVKQDLTPTEASNNLTVLKQLSTTNVKPAAPASPAIVPAPVVEAPRNPRNTTSLGSVTLPPLERPDDWSVLPTPTRIAPANASDPATSGTDNGKQQTSSNPETGSSQQAVTPARILAPLSKTPATMDPIKDPETIELPKAATSPAKPILPPKPARNQAALALPVTLRRSLSADERDESIEVANVGY